MAKMGFRGRATVAGIDLGTTNSVICVQAPSKSVGEITCIPDPVTSSPIIPSVVSFVSSSTPPLVGYDAKSRIDSHPLSTIYHAKRIIGRQFTDQAVSDLQNEVPFSIISNSTSHEPLLSLTIPSSPLSSTSLLPSADAASLPTTSRHYPPESISAMVLSYLIKLTSQHLRHNSVTTAVIAIPAEFTPSQRHATLRAYKEAGIKVLRILEEPTAAALAYGLDEKEGVEHVLVYDFGGGTLDVSVLRMARDGYVDVMGSRGDGDLGGVDFDVAVSHLLMEDVGEEKRKGVEDMLERMGVGEDDVWAVCAGEERKGSLCTSGAFHSMAERMKIALSGLVDDNETDSVARDQCWLVDDGYFDDAAATLSLERLCDHLTVREFQLSKDDFNRVSKPLFERSVLPIRQVLKDLGMSKEDIDEVVMVGGTTRMPQIRELVKKELNVKQLNVEIDPDLTVAYGAASVID